MLIEGKSLELEQSINLANCDCNLSQNMGSQKKVRKTIKNLFGSTNKFQKCLKRNGIYFASLIYNQQKVLITNEEILPLIEIGKYFQRIQKKR